MPPVKYLFAFFSAVCGLAYAAEPPRAALERFCIDCHDTDAKKGGVDLNSILSQDITVHAGIWEKVVKQLNARHMPPIGKKRPDEQGYEKLVAALTTELDAHPKTIPGPAFRRLTRTEYQNVVRDLLAVEFDAKAALPMDEISHGFDNVTVADLPPALLDRYISAAQKIARLAVGTLTQPEITAIRVRPDITQEYHVPGLPLGTRGGVLVKQVFAQSGDYEVQVRLQRDRNEQVEGMHGRHQLQILLDREVMSEFSVQPANDKNYEKIDAHLKARFHVTGGQHDLGVTFLPKGSPVLERLRQPYKSSYNLHRHPRLNPAVYQVTITGPLQAEGAGDTPSRRLIFGAGKTDPRAILKPILHRAWRRDISDADVERLLPFVREASSLEKGIESAVAAILVSREFLFRTEQPSDEAALASKLAFFLWSSLPDDELLSQHPLNLEAQARRMLRDPRAKALVTNFADQWLYLRNLDSITPDARLFPDFDHNLRESLRTETSLLLADVIDNDRSVLELLRTDRTWVDERLAAHYGIPHIHGSRFREVKLSPQTERGGLLRQGSILTVTSYATRTSPVIRGHWILKNLLATEPPPPPPNVPALDGVISESLPIRERLAQHRKMAACASCHNLMDPVGFALENYDAIGRWRAEADARGGFADGSEFEGVSGLEDTLLNRPDLFVTALTEKLLVYALGRGLEPEDAPTVRKVVRRAKANGWKFSEIIVGIATSEPFMLKPNKP
jgi:cytochrome c553